MELNEQQIIEQGEKIVRAKKIIVITNIFLIVLIFLIGVYVILNLEAFKTLGQDVCKLCIQKTNMTCYLPLK